MGVAVVVDRAVYAGLLLIVAGTLIALNRRGEIRSFWAGFAICGILHMLLVFRPGLENGIPALHPGAFVTTWASAYTQIKPQLTVKPTPTDPAVLGTLSLAIYRRQPIGQNSTADSADKRG